MVAILLLPSAAQANIEGRRVERAGTGEVPHEADLLTYRIDFAWQHEPAKRTEGTVRGSEIALKYEYHADLMAMRVGEVRRVWGHGVDGNWCDHFGCAPAQRFSARIELVAVTSHHDPLPGGLRIAAHPLRVVDGAISAELPGDYAWTIREVRLKNSMVSLEVTYEPGTRVATITFALDELRARLLDSRAVRALARGNTRIATTLLEKALALWPLDEASVHLAAALLRRAGTTAANEALHDVAVTNPVWLAWKLRADRSLASLRALPVVRALDQPHGELHATAVQEHTLLVLAEPTGQFLAVHATPTYGGDVMRIIRRASGDVVASIPVRCEVPVATQSIERCSSTTVGARALQSLGFAPIAEASMSGDLQTVRVDNLRISRWIQQPGRASDIIVEPALARVLATQSDEPPAATHPAAASPVAAAKCAAPDTRRAASHDSRPRTGDALAVLALLVLLVLGDIVLWRRGLGQHAR
jgi:hypothetical protein